MERRGFPFARPGVVEIPARDFLSAFIEQNDGPVSALRRAVHYRFAPLPQRAVFREAAFESDVAVLGDTWKFSRQRSVAAFAIFNNAGLGVQSADLGNSSRGYTVNLQQEIELPERIVALAGW